MRLSEASRWLLFSDSDWSPDRSAGDWRFRVEPLDGGRSFEAAGCEPAENRDRIALWAVIRGLESLDQPSRVTLITPSQYVSRGFRFGLQQWRQADWCWESYGRWTPIRDADLWRRVDTAMRYHDVDCRYWSLSARAATAASAGASPHFETASRRNASADFASDRLMQSQSTNLWRRVADQVSRWAITPVFTRSSAAWSMAE